MKNILILICFFTSSLLYAQLPANPEDISPLLIGEVLPKATLQTTEGKPVDISALVKVKKTVLIFYRGGWCPYCTAHLSEIARIEKELFGLGYQIIAVSPDAPEKLKPNLKDVQLTYTLLSDKNGDLTKAAGLAYKSPSYYDKILSENQGKNANLFLPVPSLFILNEQGEILFEYINPNFKNRISGYLLLAAARVFAVNKDNQK